MSDRALLTIIEHMIEQMVVLGYESTNLPKFRQFRGTWWLRSRLRVSTDLAFVQTRVTAKVNGFLLMDIVQYKNIFACIKGFPLKGHLKNVDKEIMLINVGRCYANLNHWRRKFVRSVETLLNQSTRSVVINDELIPSCAGDIEQKTLSQRKAGKDDPVSDCIVCSFTCIFMNWDCV